MENQETSIKIKHDRLKLAVPDDFPTLLEPGCSHNESQKILWVFYTESDSKSFAKTARKKDLQIIKRIQPNKRILKNLAKRVR